MIASDQPTCFPLELLVAVSSKDDGTMLNRSIDVHHQSVLENRANWCEEIGVDYGDVVYQRIVYGDDQAYNVIVEADAASTTKFIPEVRADALITRSLGVGLMLPIADCIATVMYDPQQQILALLHLGRHSTLTNIVADVVERFVTYGSQTDDIIAWMSPSVKSENYTMEYFDQAEDPEWQGFCVKDDKGYCIDLPGFNQNMFIQAGVLAQNIHISPINTALSSDYPSHFMGDTTERFAVLAMMRQGHGGIPLV